MSFDLPYYVEPVDTHDLPRRFLAALAAILAHSNYAAVLEMAARTGARCGRCSVTCPVYQSSGDPRDIPCLRSELLLDVYRRYFTVGGALRARLGGAFELDEQHIRRMAEEFYRCTACRRCNLECPIGIDHGLITRLARWALSEVDIVPKALKVSVRAQLDGAAHNTSAVPSAAMIDTCEFLAEDCKDTHGLDIEFPIDVQGAEYIFFPAVSDFLLEPDTLMGNAAVMKATGASWTIGSKYFDGINYGLFYSDRLLDRILQLEIDEVKRLGARKILIGECGHASRSAKVFSQAFGGSIPPEVVNCLEYAHRAWREGRLKLRPNTITERVTYHDPCNIARSGWIIDQPRDLIRAICSDFVEMTPHGKMNYCCGGGGGTVSIDEIRSFRTRVGGATKAEQIRRTGATLLVAPCANCKKQLAEVCQDHGLDKVKVVGLHNLLLLALAPQASENAQKSEAGNDNPKNGGSENAEKNQGRSP
jgi:Fe-S oxidoreductase